MGFLLSPRSQSLKDHLQFGLSWFVVLLAWTYYAGKDLNWDLLNYHHYLGSLYFGGRLSSDFFAASVQSYLNPLPHLPFYWLNRLGLSAFGVAAVLAALSVLNLLAIKRIAMLVIPSDHGYRIHLIRGAVALSALSPLFLIEVGTSFADVLVSIPALFGFCLLLESHLNKNNFRLLLSGFLLGLASGLKPTFALFALIACVGAIAVEYVIDWRRSFGVMIKLGVGGILGVMIAYGWWGAQLYREFGNPFFPLLNDIFKSGWFADMPLVNSRFNCNDWDCLVRLPFDVLNANLFTYAEVRAPDVKFALFFLLSILFLFRFAYLLFLGGVSRLRVGHLFCMLLFTVWVNYVIWAWGSGNGRYAIPMILLFGPLIVSILVRIGLNARYTMCVLIFFLCVQLVLVVVGSDRRFNPAPWGDKWVDVSLVDEGEALPREALYLSLNNQSVSVLVDFLGEKSRFINLVGQKTIEPQSQSGVRVASMVKKSPKVRTLYLAEAPLILGGTLERAKQSQDLLLSSYGLRVRAGSPCVGIHIRDAQPGPAVLLTAEQSRSVGERALLDLPVISCEVDVGLSDDAVRWWKSERPKVAMDYFEKFERYCWKRIRGERSVMEVLTTGARKGYINSDVIAIWMSKDRKVWVWGFEGFVGRYSPSNERQDSVLENFCLN